MKALSLRQPFAELILRGDKTIETRTWRTAFRGEFLIHAAKAIDIERCLAAKINPTTLVTGAIVGRATIVSVKDYPNTKTWLADARAHCSLVKNIDKPRYGFILKDVVRFKKPILYKGKLNFFPVNDIKIRN